MAEKEEKPKSKMSALYNKKEDKGGEHMEKTHKSEPKVDKKTEHKDGKEHGKHDGMKETIQRHHEEREHMHKAHESERKDLHGNHREEHRKMHGRHQEAHKAMADKHMAEMQEAQGAAGGEPEPGMGSGAAAEE